MLQNDIPIRKSKKDRESIRDFIAMKREMFLVQMSLDIKRAEILKLNQLAANKEKALEQSQKLLENDIERFDNFLSSNDSRVHEAMRLAEEKSKEKMMKAQQVKQLVLEINNCTLEMEKLQEEKNSALKYKKFLDAISPASWLQQQEEKKKEKKNRWIQTQLKQNKDLSKAALEKQYQELSSEDEEYEIYFTDADQLTSYFSSMEERNLSLIQQIQESSSNLDDIKKKHSEAKDALEQRTSSLKSSIQQLEKQVEEEKMKITTLQSNIQQRKDTLAKFDYLEELRKKIESVYLICQKENSVPNKNENTLDMLLYIERTISQIVEKIKKYPPELVEKAERSRELWRREQLREEKSQSLQKKQLERMALSIERAQCEKYQVVSKTLPRRSKVQAKKKVVVGRDYEKERQLLEEQMFL